MIRKIVARIGVDIVAKLNIVREVVEQLSQDVGVDTIIINLIAKGSTINYLIEAVEDIRLKIFPNKVKIIDISSGSAFYPHEKKMLSVLKITLRFTGIGETDLEEARKLVELMEIEARTLRDDIDDDLKSYLDDLEVEISDDILKVDPDHLKIFTDIVVYSMIHRNQPLLHLSKEKGIDIRKLEEINTELKEIVKRSKAPLILLGMLSVFESIDVTLSSKGRRRVRGIAFES